MKKALRVLLVEDNDRDEQLVLRELGKTGLELECRRVETAAAFTTALAQGGWHIVIAGSGLPSFNSLGALRHLRDLGSDLPFIFISEVVGEEAAVEAMRCGAQDYVLKQNLDRLAPAVQRELREAAERRRSCETPGPLKSADQLLQEITDRIPGVMFRFRYTKTGEMRFDFVSGGAETVLEFRPEQIVADFSLVWNLVLPEDLPALMESIAATRGEQSPWEHEFRIRTPSGKLKWLRGNSFTVGTEADEFDTSVGTLMDITAHKEAEAAVRRSEERYRSIFESIQDVCYETALDGTILEISHSTTALFGAGSRELIGQNASRFYLNPKDRERMLDELVVQTRLKDFEFPLRAGDGKVLHASLSAQLVHDEKGTPVKIRGILRDITERKRAEESRSRLEAQLRQAQKMEALGTLAGGIAHDFNNMLTAIMGHAELLRLDCAEQPHVRDSVEEILKAAFRAKELVQQILTFSRRREQKRVVTRLSSIVKEAAKLLRASLPSTIEMHAEIADVANVLADPTQIHQVVLNLCTNAAQAIGQQQGRLALQLAVETVDQTAASRNRSLLPRRYVVLTVRDTGCGMDPATLERIFDPFYTTKPPGEGTGLGLAVVHAIVENHEGAITVESTEGQGTTFRVFFPVIEAEPATTSGDKPPIPLGNNEEILVVDDEPPILQIAERGLARMGYRALCFNRPADALAAFEKNPARFALVLTDLTMPKMTGLDLAQRIQQIRAGTPIILLTGLGGSMTDETARQLGFKMLLAKPYEYVGLAEAIARILSESRNPNRATAQSSG